MKNFAILVSGNTHGPKRAFPLRWVFDAWTALVAATVVARAKKSANETMEANPLVLKVEVKALTTSDKPALSLL